MLYLSEKKIIHRDLAIRNLLVTIHGQNNKYLIKIADFGLSRNIDTNYYQASNSVFPVKWTAPEAVEKGKFSSMSDVWSFGIVLWELFTYGKIPYPGMSNQEVIEKVSNGYRLPPPKNCPPNIIELMNKCWSYNPKERPNFQVR